MSLLYILYRLLPIKSFIDEWLFRPVLVNVSTFRLFTSFFFTTQVTTWISQLGRPNFVSLSFSQLTTLITNRAVEVYDLPGRDASDCAMRDSTAVPLWKENPWLDLWQGRQKADSGSLEALVVKYAASYRARTSEMS